jgi:hypothetical protein
MKLGSRACVTFAALLPATTAFADITSITVVSQADLGTFAGKPYRELELQVNGTAPGGAYSIPVTLAFPLKASDANGAAVVDILNTTFVGWGHPFGNLVLPVARLQLGDDYLFRHGNVYIGPQWDKAATAILGEGTIGLGTDAWEIWRDAASLVRLPNQAPFPPGVKRPPASSKVIAYAYSQGSTLMRDYYLNERNTAEGAPVFDGAIIGSDGAFCRTPNGPGYQCPGVPSDGKLMNWNSELDSEWSGFIARGQTSEYRAYELAGIAHIPKTFLDLTDLPPEFANPNQNPVDFNPLFRGMHRNMLRWIAGQSPPPSTYITLEAGEPQDLFGSPYLPAVRDADGNALGGVRLPHMPSVVLGKPAGGPLGTYVGGWFDGPDFFSFLGGEFQPFTEAELQAHYGTHNEYVKRVTRSALALAATNWILLEDAAAYIVEARQSDVLD